MIISCWDFVRIHETYLFEFQLIHRDLNLTFDAKLRLIYIVRIEFLSYQPCSL